MMPPQLARAKRPKRSQPRPLVEQLPRIDIIDLCRWKVFPSQYDWNKAHLLELPFRYPFVKSLIISLQDIEANHHTGDTQIVPLRWCRTGYGGHHRPRPLLVCQCGRSVTRVYFKGGHLACRRCCGATYASRQCDKRLRPILQAKRLQNFLQLKAYMSQRNRQRIKARIASFLPMQSKQQKVCRGQYQMAGSNQNPRATFGWCERAEDFHLARRQPCTARLEDRRLQPHTRSRRQRSSRSSRSRHGLLGTDQAQQRGMVVGGDHAAHKRPPNQFV
jgi:hypothetical protein